MVKRSPWARSLPALGVVLASILVVALGVLWLGGGNGGAATRLIAAAQAGRVDLREALAGQPESIAALERWRTEIERLRSAAVAEGATDSATSKLLIDTLATVIGAGDMLVGFRQEREELLGLAPQLLAATGDLVSSLSPAELRANRSQIERFELAIQSIELDTRSLELPGTDVVEVTATLGDSGQFLSQVIRGLSGDDRSLGLSPVVGRAPAEDLSSATALFERARTAIDMMISMADSVALASASIDQYDAAAETLDAEYRDESMLGALAGAYGGFLPLYLVAGACAVLAIMMLAYYGARDYRRAAQLQAEQNDRNQQAILRLLDELSSLADGDLTVQATVTEDITGAIADSINYAIDALRDLVATVNDSSILVDSASKQTESTSQQLVRSSETQAKQAALASDSVAKMASSVEEISGNAERCSDVARYAVDIAHKGGEAVRRTIEGMNTIRETIQDTSKRIKRLGESSQEIGNIVELIEEIAEQTNILALNASIEASRAGEASRGFAVVADEVQKLAERSTAATRKIEVLVSTIQSDTNEAVVSMERSTTDVVGGALLAENAGAALEEIEQVSHQIASLVQNISGTARDQNRVSTAINKNMQILRHIAARSTESTASASAAISKLSGLASQLRQTVKGFTLPDEVSSTGILSQAQVAQGLREQRELEQAGALEQVEQQRQSG